MQKKHWYLIQYDVRDLRRLRRTHRLLKSCAFSLQESVFAWCGTNNQLQELQKQLASIINNKHDDIRGYRIKNPLMFFGAQPFSSDIYFAGNPPNQHCPLEHLGSPPEGLWSPV